MHFCPLSSRSLTKIYNLCQGTVSREKTAVLLDFVQITPFSQFGQLVQLFFSNVKIQDLKVSLKLKILYMLYIYNLNSLKFKLSAFWRIETPFINQKCTYENVPKKIGQGPQSPSLIWTKYK